MRSWECDDSITRLVCGYLKVHGDDEWADPATFDLFGEWLSRFLVNPDKYAAP